MRFEDLGCIDRVGRRRGKALYLMSERGVVR